MNSLFVKSTDLIALKGFIETALDNTKIFDSITYFCTKGAVDGYYVFMFRGGLLVSQEYAQLISKNQNTLAFAASYESSGLKLEFYDAGKHVFSYSAVDDFANGSGIGIVKKGNVSDLLKFCVDTASERTVALTSALESRGTLVFYWRPLFINICKSMGYQNFAPFAYWDYTNLTKFLQKNKSFEQLYKLNEIPELDEVVIKPA